MSVCFHAAGFYWKNFQRHPAAYNSPRIKLLQLRATLSDKDNVIAKRGTRGGILYITSFVTRGEASLEQRCSPRYQLPQSPR